MSRDKQVKTIGDALKWLETSPKAPQNDPTYPVVLTGPRNDRSPRTPFVNLSALSQKRRAREERKEKKEESDDA
jgi:hypothetical protein